MTDCKVGGKVDLSSVYGGAQSVSLTLSNCGCVAAGTYAGIVFANAESNPAAWQLVAENGTAAIDLLAYR